MAALLREAMKVPISNRLLLCAKFVPRGSRAADIGTDHGYLSIYLLREGICPFVTAADLREQPLQKARENAARFGVSEKCGFPVGRPAGHPARCGGYNHYGRNGRRSDGAHFRGCAMGLR